MSKLKPITLSSGMTQQLADLIKPLLCADQYRPGSPIKHLNCSEHTGGCRTCGICGVKWHVGFPADHDDHMSHCPVYLADILDRKLDDEYDKQEKSVQVRKDKARPATANV